MAPADAVGASINFGSGNIGTQVGISNGPIYVTSERPQTPRPSPQSLVPFRRDPQFVDRGTLLDQVHGKASIPGGRVALVGLGGVGKSQLAIEFCYQVRDQSPEKWVLWIHASNAARVEQSCRGIADRLKIPGHRNPQANALKLVCDWLSDSESGEWVLVLDNIDDEEILTAVSPSESVNSDLSIWAYFSQLTKGFIVVTSRNRAVAARIAEDYDILSIEPMDRAQAVSLFTKKLAAPVDENDVFELTKALDFMPLAIVQAAAYIKQRAPRQSVKRGGHLRRDLEAKNSIIVTWQISFDYLREKCNSAAELLALMSFFDRQGIPESLLRDVKQAEILTGHLFEWDSDVPDAVYEDNYYKEAINREPNNFDTFEDDIFILRDYSMISIGPDGKDFEMHRLVQLSMQKWLSDQGQLDAWKKYFFIKLSRRFPVVSSATWPQCRLVCTHFQRESKREPGSDEALDLWAMLNYKMSNFAYLEGRLADCKLAADRSRLAQLKQFGPEHEKTLASTELLASAHIAMKEPQRALELQSSVLEVRMRVTGPKHPLTLLSMDKLAYIYQHDRVRRYNEAEALQLEVTQTSQELYGLKSLAVMRGMESLADIYESQDRLEEAEKMSTQAVNIAQEVFGKLLSIYQKQSRWVEAEALHAKAIEGSRIAFGPDHPETLHMMKSLVDTYRYQKRWDDAEKLQVAIIEGLKKALGQYHIVTLSSEADLALIYSDQAQWAKAEELAQHVLAIREEALGPESSHTLNSMKDLVHIYRCQRKTDEAEEFAYEIMERSKRAVGAGHPDTLQSMGRVAMTLLAAGKTDPGMQMLKKCVQLCAHHLGPEDPNTLHFECEARLWCELIERSAEESSSEATERDDDDCDARICQMGEPDQVYEDQKERYQHISSLPTEGRRNAPRKLHRFLRILRRK
ncbi:P-loop containing nucleoside triphosphate hydrolase protein [Penicillium chermesinum]|nr:P-loop containing nucleoside triphosphate hydrolase protein [Penicillium chermesinum]